jgi:hypothetical protein
VKRPAYWILKIETRALGLRRRSVGLSPTLDSRNVKCLDKSSVRSSRNGALWKLCAFNASRDPVGSFFSILSVGEIPTTRRMMSFNDNSRYSAVLSTPIELANF